jgi:hypothetical protein
MTRRNTRHKTTDSEDLSLLRQQLRGLQDSQQTLYRSLMNSGPLIAGSYYPVYKTCTRTNCCCQRGKKHGPFPALSFSHDGRRGMIMIRAKDAPVVAVKVAAYRRFVKDVRELRQLNTKALAVVEELGRLLREEYV